MSEIAALVCDHFDIWTAATERKNGAGRGGGKRITLYGIERLRALILDLAVRGRLVPQNPHEEAACAFLAKREPEMIKGKGRRKSELPPISDDNLNLPIGWTALHLASLAEIVRGITFPGSEKSKNPEEGRVACLRTSNVQDAIEWDDLLFIRDQFVSRPDQYIVKNDIIMSMANSRELVGKVAIVDFQPELQVTFGGFLGAIRAHSIEPHFLMLYLRCPSTKRQIIDEASQTTNIANISLAKLNPLVVPVPPITEQRRIVAKVDELMGLCNALEGEGATALTAHQALVETMLATLVNSADAADLTANWSRLEAHLDTLLTTEASVDVLKQTILELAVSGRLVSNSDEVKPGTLDDVGDWVGGNGFPKQFQGNQEGEFAFLKVSDMNLPGNERQITVSNNWVSADALRAMRARAHPVGTIIFPKIGGAIATNKRRILAVPAAIDNNCAGQIPRKGIDVDWLFMVLSSIDMSAYQAGTSVPALNMKRLGKHPVAIPSIEAQREIVAKVDALMALCDGLKANITDAGKIQMRLADGIVERAAA